MDQHVLDLGAGVLELLLAVHNIQHCILMEDHAHLGCGVREAIDAEFSPESANHQVSIDELEEADGVFGALLAVLVLD